jgi:glycerophosphoryl diester phosphodiesterase
VRTGVEPCDARGERVTWVIAHRGASAEERENTLPAFERAIEMGADFVEFDIQASSDGALVVFHDLTLDRLTPARGALRRRPLAELRELGIPTLEEVLELTAGRIGVMAELKSPWLFRRHDFVARAVRLLPDDGVVVSFSRTAIRETQRARPALRTVQHVGYGTSIRAASGFAWAAGFDDARATARGIAKARSLGLKALVYTVNAPARILALRELGVDGVFTDCPDLARSALAGRPG